MLGAMETLGFGVRPLIDLSHRLIPIYQASE